MALRRIAHDRRGASDLRADAVEHTPIDAGDRRWRPGQRRRMDDGALGEVGV